MIEFKALGSIDLRRQDGTELLSVLSQPKRTALLAYLLLARPRGYQRRDRLVALFWPEVDAEHARNSLRQAVHFLRRYAFDDLIVSHGDDELGVGEGAVRCDVHAFEAAADRGDGEAALALYGGELLPGFFVEGAPEFEHWLDAERMRLQARATKVARELAQAKERSGDAAYAVELGARALALTPDDESLLREHMQRLERTGDRAGAIACYESHARHMLVEYELEPAAETRTLAEEIRARSNLGVVTPAPSPQQPAAAPPSVQPPAPALQPTSALPPPPPEAGRRPPVRWLTGPRLAAGVAAIVLVLAGLVATRREPLPSDALLVIADITNRTTDARLGPVVTELLRTDLQSSEAVRLLEDADVADILERMQLPRDTTLEPPIARELSRRAGAELLLEGTVGSLGTGYLLTARLLFAESRETLETFREVARSPASLYDAVNALSRAVRRELGDSRGAIRDTPPLADVTSPSLAALEAYTEAQRMMRGSKPGARDRFEGLMQQAIAIDTTFSIAFRTLGVYFNNAGQREKAVHYLRKAFQFRHRTPLADRYYTEATYYVLVTGEREKAIAAFLTAQRLTRSKRLRAGTFEHLGGLYYSLREYEAAEQMWRQRDEENPGPDPTPPYVYTRIAEALCAQGKVEEAHQVVLKADSLWPGMTGLVVEVAYHLGGVPAADSVIAAWRKRLRENGGPAEEESWAHGYLAALAVLEGRLSEAERLRRRTSPSPQQTRFLSVVDFFVRADPSSSARTLERLLTRRWLDSIPLLQRPYHWLVEALSRAGRAREARAFLAEWETQVPDSLRVRRGDTARGELALAENRPADAVLHLRAAVASSRCVNCELPSLGRAYEAAGQPDSALAVYSRYVVRPRDLESVHVDAAYLAFVYERLAHLYEQRGEGANAAGYYQRFVDLWKHADPELQPRVRRARQRLAELASEPRERLPASRH